MTPVGFPHSDIHGSQPAFGFPWLFVDRYVLHRLPVPRHPPCALVRLTITKFYFVQSNHARITFGFFHRLPIVKTNDALDICIFELFLLTLHFAFLFLYSVFKVPALRRSAVVGSSGLEPPTSRLSGVRSNHLSYEPILWPTAAARCLLGLPWWR